jgi:uncharacterized protein with von Willebrand factor type A (vWA) domain
VAETLRDDSDEGERQVRKKLFLIADHMTEGAQRMAQVVLSACTVADRHWDRALAASLDRVRAAYDLCHKHEVAAALKSRAWAEQERARASRLREERERWSAQVRERERALAEEEAAWEQMHSRHLEELAQGQLHGQRLQDGLHDALAWPADRSPLAHEVRAELVGAMGAGTPEQLLAILARYRQDLDNLA